jgi:hypothetical protein
MRGLQIAVALGTLSIITIPGVGAGVGWFISAASSHLNSQDGNKLVRSGSTEKSLGAE